MLRVYIHICRFSTNHLFTFYVIKNISLSVSSPAGVLHIISAFMQILIARHFPAPNCVFRANARYVHFHYSFGLCRCARKKARRKKRHKKCRSVKRSHGFQPNFARAFVSPTLLNVQKYRRYKIRGFAAVAC